MPRGSRGDQRLAGAVGLNFDVLQIATGQIRGAPDAYEDGKDKAAQALGRNGGVARAASLTPERRAEIARAAAAKRWSRNNLRIFR